MSRFYGLPIRVKRNPDGKPHSFVWHEQRYRIVAVYNTWHLMDRWWERGNVRPSLQSKLRFGRSLPWAARGESDRLYWRVECTPWLQADISYDQAQNVWVLDRILD